MVISKKEDNPRVDISIDNTNIKQVQSFNYLGSLITSDGRCEKEIKRRIVLAKNSFKKLRTMVTNTKINLNLRRRFVKTYVWSTMLYGCEAWTLNKELENRIQAAEMWFWRRLLKVPWTAPKTNKEIFESINTKREMLKIIKKDSGDSLAIEKPTT